MQFKLIEIAKWIMWKLVRDGTKPPVLPLISASKVALASEESHIFYNR